MCDRLGPHHAPRPRWGSLYTIVGTAAVATAAARTALPVSLLRGAMLLAIPLLTGAALALWVATNRVALDLAGWCDCAGSAVRVRVIDAAPPPPRVTLPVTRPLERTTLRG